MMVSHAYMLIVVSFSLLVVVDVVVVVGGGGGGGLNCLVAKKLSSMIQNVEYCHRYIKMHL